MTLSPRPLILFFILAYALSWLVELPLVAVARGWTSYPVPFALHYLAAFGPMLAAFIVVGLFEGRRGINLILKKLVQRVHLTWLLFAVGSPLLLFVIALLLNRVTTGVWSDLRLLGEVDYLPYLGVPAALVLWLITFGLGEEVGWRGYALPRLQKRYSALTATFVLGGLWTFWHLPAFFYRDTYMEMGFLTGLPMLLFSILAASVVFTWLYNSTGGSLLAVTLFHGLFDFFSVSSAGGRSAAIVMSAAVTVWAVLLIRRYKLGNLSHCRKQVYPPD